MLNPPIIIFRIVNNSSPNSFVQVSTKNKIIIESKAQFDQLILYYQMD